MEWRVATYSPGLAIIGAVLGWAVWWIAGVTAVRRGRRRVLAAQQALAAGIPFREDIGAHLVAGPSRRRRRRYVYGDIRIRPTTVMWVPRSPRRASSRELTGAEFTGEEGSVTFSNPITAQHRMVVRQGEETIALLVREPQKQLLITGLEQVRRAVTPVRSDGSRAVGAG
jgi:hypothetical protein